MRASVSLNLVAAIFVVSLSQSFSSLRAAQGPPPATVGMKTSRDGARVLRAQLEVEAPLREVWKLWTTSDGVTKLAAQKADIELKLGGKYEWYFNSDAPAGLRGSEGCTVLSFIPQRMLSFTWNAPPSIPALRESGNKTFVVLEFEELGSKRTRVTFTQLGFGDGPDWDKYYDYFDRAWANVLSAMVKQFEPDAPAEVDPSAETAPKRYVYFVFPAREDFFAEPTQPELKVIEDHFEYLRRHTQQRTVLLAGRAIGKGVEPLSSARTAGLDTPALGIVVLETPTQDEARWIMASDPAVKAGVFKAVLYPFNMPLMRGVSEP